MGEKLKGKKLKSSSNSEDLNKNIGMKKEAISFEGSPRAGEKKKKTVNHLEKKIKSRKIRNEKKPVLNVAEDNFKVRKRKISSKELKVDLSEDVLAKKEAIEDEKIETEETMSIAVVLIILLVCFVIGVLLGYLLYHIAINSSNALLIIQNLF